jgi:hypothetical protein
MRSHSFRISAFACLVFLFGSAYAGHDNIQVDPAMKRYAGQVIALGDADAQGNVRSFQLRRLPAGPAFAPDELRGWRLTMLAGKRFGQAYEVAGNTGTEVKVSPRGEPLDGVAAQDVFVIENTPLLPSSSAQQ